jgi:hypothetical protein
LVEIAEKRAAKVTATGARKMAHVAQEVLGQNHGWNPVRRRITT